MCNLSIQYLTQILPLSLSLMYIYLLILILCVTIHLTIRSRRIDTVCESVRGETGRRRLRVKQKVWKLTHKSTQSYITGVCRCDTRTLARFISQSCGNSLVTLVTVAVSIMGGPMGEWAYKEYREKMRAEVRNTQRDSCPLLHVWGKRVYL